MPAGINEDFLSIEALGIADAAKTTFANQRSPLPVPYLIYTDCKDTAEVTPVHNIVSVGDGYCQGQASIGTSWTQKPAYPFPRTYQRASAEEQQLRDQELERAKQDNWYASDLIDGAVVHANVSSPDVRGNSLWTLRGTDAQRQQFAQEDDLGVDDAHPAEDAIDFFEALFPYFEKNWRVWATNPRALENIRRLLSILVENALDGSSPDRVKLGLVDHILVLVPATRTLNVDHWDFYPEIGNKYPKQPFDAEFRDDDIIAWLQVAAGSPYTRLKPYTEHQANFQVTNQHFQQTEPFKDDDLDTAMAEGRVFITDFKEFHHANTAKPVADDSDGGRFYAAIAMFAVPKNGGPLKTIAIQSTQHTPQSTQERLLWKLLNIQDADKPLSDIITPGGDYWSWQMAKTLFLSMYAICNVVDHLSTHMFLGPIPVAFYRNIPNQHPLTALLETHFMSLVTNNHLGVFWEVGTTNAEDYGKPDHGLLSGLANKLTGWTGETFVEETIRLAKTYDFVETSTPFNRKTDTGFAKIEDFPLYDDEGIYPIVEKWVRNYLGLYYRYDSDVANDHELQAFCYEVVNEAKVAGFPESLNTVEALIDTITRLIYWMTNQHALEATLSAQKLAPVGYWSDRVPRNDEIKLEADWFNILPPINVGMAVFCASRIFVDLPREWHRSLGKYPKGQFMHDQRVYKHLRRFQQDLVDLDNSIQTKNQSRRWAYNLKRPSTMTCSPWN